MENRSPASGESNGRERGKERERGRGREGTLVAMTKLVPPEMKHTFTVTAAIWRIDLALSWWVAFGEGVSICCVLSFSTVEGAGASQKALRCGGLADLENDCLE
ncbi:unnamed protein product [Gadus morhua 'NCC']